MTCAASVASLNGKAALSFKVLERALKASADAVIVERQWALTTLADIATRLGRARVAEEHLQAALSLGENTWLLGAYPNFLLEQHRPQAVIKLLKDHTDVDNLLLLLALAEQEVNAPQLGKHGGSSGSITRAPPVRRSSVPMIRCRASSWVAPTCGGSS